MQNRWLCLLCLFRIFCRAQTDTSEFQNTAAFSNVAPVQLYLAILQCHNEGFGINETNGGKVMIGPIDILAVGGVRDPSLSKKKAIFHDTNECESPHFYLFMS